MASLTSCLKEDDFSELRHDFRIQGEFDPVYGIPLAKMSADIATLVGIFDTNADLMIYIDSNGTAAFRFTHQETVNLDWSVAKHSPRTKGSADTTYASFYITGNQAIDLFDKWDFGDTNALRAQEVRVTLTAFLQATVNASFQYLIDCGANLFFDNMTLTGECNDGYVKILRLMNDTTRVTAQALIDGTLLSLLDKYNFAGIIQHRPNNVIYSVRANLAIPSSMIGNEDFNLSLEQMGVERLDANLDIAVDLPLEFYCDRFMYQDTFEVDLSSAAIEMDSLNNLYATDGLSLGINDSNCYIGLEVINELPIAAWANMQLLDSNLVPLSEQPLFENSLAIPGAPVKLNEDGTAYISNGTQRNTSRLPITPDVLRQLNSSRYLVLSLGANTSTLGADRPNPIVAVRQHDKLKARAFAVLSPHAQFSLDIDNPLISK